MAPQRQKLLSSSRPQVTKSTNLSSKNTQAIISKHHTLLKQIAQARKTGDDSLLKTLEDQIEATGGLELYQRASVQGQSRDRGGDTSQVLMGWLGLSKYSKLEKPLRILEVGALSTKNALNIEDVTKVRRIDLQSQEHSIEEMDFMVLDPEQTWEGEKGYAVLSLSLVVNYVDDPKRRGDMLRHTVSFLTQLRSFGDLPPVLFLVLPLPCVDNSRYLSEEHLESMLASLGYEKSKAKRSTKLYYSLWQLPRSGTDATAEGTCDVFKKVELRSGSKRNNFCITLEPS